MTLTIGKIDYLNIWHVFQLLADVCPEGPDFHYVPGHPNELNRALSAGTLDISPSSSFEYLLNAEQYRLLPGASISAAREVQSVLFLAPVDPEGLAAWMSANPGPVCVTGASATSTALLKVLWTQKWGLPDADWLHVPPGSGLATGRPFLEIGNLALHHFISPPTGYRIIDLATQWSEWTGLPFVFAVWIVRRALSPCTQVLLSRLGQEISRITDELDRHYPELAERPSRPDWLCSSDLQRYWQTMSYGLGPAEQAALALFGERLTTQGLLPGMPGLSFVHF